MMSFFSENVPAAPPATGSDSSGLQMLIWVAVAFFLMYFIMWRPESKKRKEEEKKRASMKKGDRVTTFGGEVGVIIKISEDTVLVRTGEAKIEFMKAAIHDVQPASEEESKKVEE